MQSKVLFVSAILAQASVSLASYTQQSLATKSHSTLAAQATNGQIYGPFQLQHVIWLPKLGAELRKRTEGSKGVCLTCNGDAWEEMTILSTCLLDKTTSSTCSISASANLHIVECPSEDTPAVGNGQDAPCDKDLPAQAEVSVEPTPTKSRSKPNKVELRDSTETHIFARANGEISEQIQSAIPPAVRDALLNDPDAAESLASEFSGDSTPEWYATLPSDVQNYYATITPPPLMTGAAIDDELANDVKEYESKISAWISSISFYNSQISLYSVEAAEQSRQADLLSQAARSNSIEASSATNTALQTSAWLQSLLAESASAAAASESTVAASASKAVGGMEYDIQELQKGAASTTKLELTLVSSIFGAGLCMVLAAIL